MQCKLFVHYKPPPDCKQAPGYSHASPDLGLPEAKSCHAISDDKPFAAKREQCVLSLRPEITRKYTLRGHLNKMAYIDVKSHQGSTHKADYFWADHELGWMRIQPPVELGEIVLEHALSDHEGEVQYISHAATTQPSESSPGGTLLQFAVDVNVVTTPEELDEVASDIAKVLVMYADAASDDSVFRQMN
jgi:hypothetical protein